jgi:hypothetical protein
MSGRVQSPIFSARRLNADGCPLANLTIFSDTYWTFAHQQPAGDSANKAIWRHVELSRCVARSSGGVPSALLQSAKNDKVTTRHPPSTIPDSGQTVRCHAGQIARPWTGGREKSVGWLTICVR